MIETIREFQGLIALAVSLLIGVFAWAFRSEVQKMVADRASSAALARVATQVEDVDRRVISIEERLMTLPSAEQMHQLALRIETLAGDVRSTLAQLAGTNEMLRGHARKLDLIDDFLRGERS